jgi:hypothetical protein
MGKDNMIPEIKKNVLSDEDFSRLVSYFKGAIENSDVEYDEYGRKFLSPPILDEYAEKLLPMARNFFNSDTLLYSYALFAEYSDKNIFLKSHTDINACTYTIDLVVYQNKPWALWIEGKEYLAEENEAILFWGEEQEHWRNRVENNDGACAVIFFHYVEPDHWWFTKGRDHIFELWKIEAAKEKNGGNQDV